MGALARRRSSLALVVALIGIAVVALVVLAPKPALGLDPRAASCSVIDGAIARQFELEHASDYRKAFPKMGYSPELEVDTPAFVVVYDGEAEFNVGGGGAPPGIDENGNPLPAPSANDTETGVVCVVVDGVRTVYVNVDTTS